MLVYQNADSSWQGRSAKNIYGGEIGQNQVHGGAKGQKPLNFDVFRLFMGVQGVQGVQPFTPLVHGL